MYTQVDKTILGGIFNKVGRGNHLDLREVEFTEDIIISERSIELRSCKGKRLTIEHCKGVVKIIDCEFDELVAIDNTASNNFEFKGKITKQLTFTNSPEKLKIWESTIAYLELPPSKPRREVVVKSSTVQALMIRNISSDLELDTVDIEKVLSIINSAFDENVIFQNVNLYNASIIISGSSITRAKFHSIRWMKDYDIDTLEYLDKNQSYNDYETSLWFLRESYRQLKVISLGFENKIDAKHFQTNELATYYRELTLKTFGAIRQYKTNFLKAISDLFKRTIKRQFWNNLSRWFLLCTNKLFSHFGNSYIRPLIFLFGVHFIFIWKGLDLFRTKINWINPDWIVTWKAIGLYLYSISPVHPIELKDIYGMPIQSNLTADFFMRICAGYFIYYFLKATRQYNFNV